MDPAGSLDPKQLKAAFKAFKKRLKLTRLDDESRIGNRALTGGGSSHIVAIVPPVDFSQEIWQELVRLGKLKPAGRGTFELILDD
ncbi:MAG: hypothetical protein EXR99_04260 [Gemmataceae bacterium]|nr:hypothetical protein [Gemmataceae bacterium]